MKTPIIRRFLAELALLALYASSAFAQVYQWTNFRSMPVNGLTHGANYSFRVRAIGGSTGSSDWSDAVQHMSL